MVDRRLAANTTPGFNAKTFRILLVARLVKWYGPGDPDTVAMRDEIMEDVRQSTPLTERQAYKAGRAKRNKYQRDLMRRRRNTPPERWTKE